MRAGFNIYNSINDRDRAMYGFSGDIELQLAPVEEDSAASLSTITLSLAIVSSLFLF